MEKVSRKVVCRKEK